MEAIQMVDLKGQYLKIKDEIDFAIHSVIESASFVKGKEVTAFEGLLSQYTGSRHVIACGNGTDALQIAMMALGLKPGDEVITADFTFIATAEVIALLGLTPVLTDVDEKTFLITPELIEKAITPRTKAIVPVHLFGQCADMEKIMEIAGRHGLFVIEDVAQANGADITFIDGSVHKAGTIGHIGCTSFFPSKNLGCFGDGGALMTNDDNMAKTMRSIANHGMAQRYYHDNIGINSRLDSVQAAVLSVKLKYLDEYNNARNFAADFYDNGLRNLPLLTIPARVPWSNHIFHQYTVTVQNSKRNELKQFLEKKSIPSMVYYPVPIHSQRAYAKYCFDDNSFAITNRLASTVLSLPMHTELSFAQLKHITGVIKEFFSTM